MYVVKLYALINLITVGCNKNFLLLLFDEWRGPTVVTGLTRKSLRATISFPFARFNWALPHNTSSPGAITLEPSIFPIPIYHKLSEAHFWREHPPPTIHSAVCYLKGGFDPDYSNFSTRFACQFAGEEKLPAARIFLAQIPTHWTGGKYFPTIFSRLDGALGATFPNSRVFHTQRSIVVGSGLDRDLLMVKYPRFELTGTCHIT